MICPQCSRGNLDGSRFCAFCGAQFSAPAQEAPGERTTLGTVLKQRYEIQSLIGMGWLGGVFKAFDRVTNQTIAVKVIFRETLERHFPQGDFRGPFYEALDPLTSLTHVNLVNVLDLGEHAGEFFICQDYVEGANFEFLLQREQTFRRERVLQTARDSAQALAFLNNHGLLHRDVKPSNIFQTFQGPVKIRDAGLAPIRVTSTSVLTRKGEFLGTPEYLAPEVVRGDEATASSDLFSLGVLLYEMLTGENPFRGKSPVISAQLVLQRDPVPPSAHCRHSDQGLDIVVARLLAKDPAHRYASAAELVEDLRQFQEPVKDAAATMLLEMPPSLPFGQDDGAADVESSSEDFPAPPEISGSPPPRHSKIFQKAILEPGPAKTEKDMDPPPPLPSPPATRRTGEIPSPSRTTGEIPSPLRPTGEIPVLKPSSGEIPRPNRLAGEVPQRKSKDSKELLQPPPPIRRRLDEAFDAYVQERYRKALEVYDGLMASSKQHLESWIGKAMVLLELERWKELQEFLQRATLVFPRSLELKVIKATSQARDGQWKHALKQVEEVLEQDDTLELAWYIKGEILLPHKPKEAENAFKKLEAENKGKWYVYCQIGKAHLLAGRWEDARDCFKHAIVYNRNCALLHFYLGRSIQGTGDWDRACDAYQKALSLDAGFVRAAAALKDKKGLVFAQDVLLKSVVLEEAK